MSFSDASEIVLILVGDSDISRWPSDELPSVVSGNNNPLLEHHHLKQVTLNKSKSGATMTDVQKQVQEALEELKKLNKSKKLSSENKNQHHHQHQRIFFLMCAGENDISSGRTVDDVIASFQEVVEYIFSNSSCKDIPHLIFFGPKFEPWLNDDSAARKSYFQLSERLTRACETLTLKVCQDHNNQRGGHHCHADGINIVYIDCLTKFCGESAKVKGGILGGRAKAELKYFDNDGLHLSSEGYKVWKGDVEQALTRIICTEECGDTLDSIHFGNKIDLK
mmetsp:Transcript_22556/g.33745  ORF Transcript_22556/g.33745 Transcript_22556/m.33745 type:complete len:279 (-) Transcript_22556:315-1151(-)